MKLDKTGTILIASLWIVAILSILAIGIGFRVSLELRLSRYNMYKLKALYLAKAGIVKSQELLSRDSKEDYDTLYECGISFDIDETPESVFGAASNKLDNGSFAIYYTQKKEGEEGYEIRYGLMDEERKININMSKSTHNDVIEFTRILKGLSPRRLTDEIINAIIDWQDADFESRLPGGGENDDYYQRLDHPYECKNGDFSCIEELLLVKDMRQDIFDEIKDYITVYGAGKINVNTASEKVLDAVIKSDDSGTHELLVSRINAHRKGVDSKYFSEDDGYFLTLNDISGGSTEQALLGDYFIFKSTNFRIISYGNVRGMTKTITAVVEKEGKTEYYHEE